MDSPLDNKIAEGRLTSLEEQLSNLAREAGVRPLTPPTYLKSFLTPLATMHQLADWRYLAVVGPVLAVTVGGLAWWWSSSAETPMMSPSSASPPTQALSKDAAPIAVALSSDLVQQLQRTARELADLRQAVEQLEAKQEQLGRSHESLASELKASRADVARNNDVIDQIKITQMQMARESETVTERLNAGQEQLARLIANASEPKVLPEEPKVSVEQPKVVPDTPVPRPRPASVAHAPKPAPVPARPQSSKPPPSAWPWSVR